MICNEKGKRDTGGWLEGPYILSSSHANQTTGQKHYGRAQVGGGVYRKPESVLAHGRKDYVIGERYVEPHNRAASSRVVEVMFAVTV